MRRPVVQSLTLLAALAVVSCGGKGNGSSTPPADTGAGGRGGGGGGGGSGTDGSAGAGGSAGTGGSAGRDGSAGAGGTGGTAGRDGAADVPMRDGPATDAPRVDSGSAVGNTICPNDTNSMCTQTEIDTYNNCLSTACDSTFKMCFGDVKKGDYSGPCGPVVMCSNKCACNDTACRNACPQPNAACIACLIGPGLTCQNNSGCTRPACYGPAPMLPDGGFPTLPDGGLPPLPDGGLGGGCAELLTCCNAISDPMQKAQCVAAHGMLAAMAGGDASCGVLLVAYRFAGVCQ
jgi:hypothetical protein